MKRNSMNIFIVAMMFMYLFVGTIAIASSASSKITKCQDAEGKWHYGTSNAYHCASSSKITTIDGKGVTIAQENALKTEEQLEEERKQKEVADALEAQKKFEEAERDRILMVYQSDEDVERSRLNQLNSLKQKKAQHESYIVSLEKQKEQLKKKKANTKNVVIRKNLDDKAALIDPKIEKSKQRIIEIGSQVEEVNKKFDEDLAFFRKHNNK